MVIELVAIGAVLLLVGWLGVAQYGFARHVRRLEEDLGLMGTPRQGRTDLPPEIVALARRLGSRVGGSPTATFTQTGAMWSAPGSSSTPFTATQTVAVGESGFCWRAAMGPLGAVRAVDYLVRGEGGLEVRLLGAVRLVRMVGTPEAHLGEALRYLAELPLNPDAILANRALDWTVVNARTMRVGQGQGTWRAEIAFVLDQAGFIVSAHAAARPYADHGTTVMRPWHGRFAGYERVGGRVLPRVGEVAWVLPAGEFVYWKGRILDWHRSDAG